MRILFSSLEFAPPLFSGNGTYSRVLVRALLAHHHSVTVVTARPEQEAHPKRQSEDLLSELYSGKVPPSITEDQWSCHIVTVSRWGRVDRASAWEEWADGVCTFLEQAKSGDYDQVVCVDWTGYLAVKSILDREPSLPLSFMAFRLHHLSHGNSDDDSAFYLKHELAGYLRARVVLTLCPMETDIVRSLIARASDGERDGRKGADVSTLIPPLREDVRELAMAARENDAVPSRKYLLCCVRLHVEKSPIVFVQVVEKLHSYLEEKEIVPYLVGAGTGEYANEVRQSLQAIGIPVIVQEGGLSTRELCHVFQQTVLNIHPALYEPYGMTIVEAAAFGTPSLTHHEQIGALELLSPEREQEVFVIDMSASVDTIAGQVRDTIECALSDDSGSEERSKVALSYDESAHAAELNEYMTIR